MLISPITDYLSLRLSLELELVDLVGQQVHLPLRLPDQRLHPLPLVVEVAVSYSEVAENSVLLGSDANLGVAEDEEIVVVGDSPPAFVEVKDSVVAVPQRHQHPETSLSPSDRNGSLTVGCDHLVVDGLYDQHNVRVVVNVAVEVGSIELVELVEQLCSPYSPYLTFEGKDELLPILFVRLVEDFSILEEVRSASMVAFLHPGEELNWWGLPGFRLFQLLIQLINPFLECSHLLQQ